MTWMVVFVTALGLSMDAFAVSISNSLCFGGLKKRQIIANAVAFGLFQGVMPAIGFFAGRLFAGVITAVDHWVALVLLGFIGGKMVVEGVRALKAPESCPEGSTYTGKTMLMQAVATSIDALAVGVSMAALSLPGSIWLCVGLIAVTTFVCCVAGGFLGRMGGALLGDWAQIFGGLLLVGIGAKIFIEHMFFGG